jgi:hypothetical protein
MGGRIDTLANVYTGLERKTVDTSSTSPVDVKPVPKNSNGIPVVDQTGQQNILNNYRSYTYNFTLSAVKKSDVKDPSKYRNSSADFIIARSGGKGTGLITSDGTPGSSTGIFRSREGKSEALDTDSTVSTIVEGFNQRSPGRFDLFIDNVEIETIMGFSRDSGITQPTKIKFDIIEPYSINGFIEALHTTAIAAGYPTYSSASFLLKMDFIGYPDSNDFSKPEVVDKSTRYFLFGFSGMSVEVGASGTHYSCAAVPFEQRAFGQPNRLKQPVSMSGDTVGSILRDLIKNIEDQEHLSNESCRADALRYGKNKYSIKFPSWIDGKGFDDTVENKIANSKVLDLLKDNAIYHFDDPATTMQDTAYQRERQTAATDPRVLNNINSVTGESLGGSSYVPKRVQVQFAENANIHECIASLIRDSEYVRGILANLQEHLDEYGMFDYFLIKLEVENLDTIDELSRLPHQQYTYVVTPHKIHFSKIPNRGDIVVDQSKLKRLSLREYNYIYTGKNIDILNFKLNFNSLYFEAIPRSLGNNDTPSARNAAARDESIRMQSNGSDMNAIRSDQNSGGSVRTSAAATSVVPQSGSAGQVLTDPYGVLSRNMHEAIINSKVSLISGEIEILGDPFYIVTGGIGNYNPPSAARGLTTDGEAAFNYSEVLITINFQNPTDVAYLKPGGVLKSENIPFSGVYRVNRVQNQFNNGEFKQVLEIIRIPGQVDPRTSSVAIGNPVDKETTIDRKSVV